MDSLLIIEVYIRLGALLTTRVDIFTHMLKVNELAWNDLFYITLPR